MKPSLNKIICLEFGNFVKNNIKQFEQASLGRSCSEPIPKSLLYGKLIVSKCNRGRQKLRFKDVCKRDIKSLKIRTDELELLAYDPAKRKSTVHKRLKERKKEYFQKSKKIKK